jgi:hypothetical protein
MFVQYFSHVERSHDEVERALLAAVDQLPRWAEGAYRSGEALRARIGPKTDPPLIAKTVRLEVGTPVRGEETATVPLAWEAAGTPGLFPRMSADLVVAPLGVDMTEVRFRGSYEPPLGTIGRALDRAWLHRLAEASVKNFVDRIVAAVAKPPEEPTQTTIDQPDS